LTTAAEAKGLIQPRPAKELLLQFESSVTLAPSAYWQGKQRGKNLLSRENSLLAGPTPSG